VDPYTEVLNLTVEHNIFVKKFLVLESM